MTETTTRLSQLRIQIDKIDSDILDCLSKRAKVSERIAELKRITNANVLDSQREREKLQVLRSQSEQMNIDVNFSEKLFELVILESRRIQENL